MSRLVWLIPLFPLVGSAVNALFGRAIGSRAHWIAVPALAASFLASCAVFARVWSGETFVGELFPWISAGTFKTALVVQVDQLSAVMLLVVTGVGFLIHLYSAGYMHGDPGYARFFTYLNLFVFSMVMLVLAGNFLVLYVFWEAVGLCSYLLIGFWYERKSAADAGKKAFIVNRVGDFGFGLGIMLIWVTFGTLDYGAVFAKADASVGVGTYTAIALLLFMGACGKSAQLPLHTWLPDAMEGPTPVSALIHAATMVTAGVYMVARCHKLFEMAPVSLEVVAWVGGITALFAASIGLVQTDIKRVLAYSTISQLGYMFVGVGVGAYAAGIFHLVTHAFFKALLFLGAGSVIHGLHGEQDLRKMGGLKSKMLITTITFLVGALGLAGVPPAGRLLLQGRDPRRRLLRGPPRALHHPARGRLHDRLLHLPSRHPRLLRRAADEPGGAPPRARVAHGDDPAAGRTRCPHRGGGGGAGCPVVARHGLRPLPRPRPAPRRGGPRRHRQGAAPGLGGGGGGGRLLRLGGVRAPAGARRRRSGCRATRSTRCC